MNKLYFFVVVYSHVFLYIYIYWSRQRICFISSFYLKCIKYLEITDVDFIFLFSLWPLHQHPSFFFCSFLQDEHLLRSNSLTERVKLWDRYTGMVDQDAVKLNFLRQIHRENPPFRIKIRLPPRKSVSVSLVQVSLFCLLDWLVWIASFISYLER